MRKTLISVLTVFLAVVLAYGLASAQLTGQQCAACHTMHNSQDGQFVVQTYNGSGGLNSQVSTPQDYLLVADCIGCHTGTTGETNSFGAPIVLHLTCPSSQGGSSTLAGGDFCYVATGIGTPADSKGHNVSGLASVDGAIGYTPPGFDSTATSGLAGTVGATWDSSNQLSCAGTNGCHVIHDSTGITGAHHGNIDGSATSATTDPSTVGGSYRFLGGIRGIEDSNWNYGETVSNHNEYYGVNSPDNRDLTSTTYANTNTISFSCAECHGYFHSRIDSSTTGSSPWRRHPTDIMLPNSTEYASYNPNVGGSPRTYSLEAPVARPSLPPTDKSQVTPGTDAVVMCLSCHRAHGSPIADLLRWDYSNMIAGNGGSYAGTGCFVCHTEKD